MVSGVWGMGCRVLGYGELVGGNTIVFCDGHPDPA